MTSPALLVVAAFALLLGPKSSPSGKPESPDPSSAKTPPAPGTSIDPAVVPTSKGGKTPAKPKSKAKGKGKGKSGPDHEGLATPPAGLRFVYVTATDLVASARGELFVRVDGSLGAVTPSATEHTYSMARTQLRVPDGARVRWLDCAITSTGGEQVNTFVVNASLWRVRYDEHPDDPSYYRPVANVEVHNTRAIGAGERGRTFGTGVEISASPNALASDDGWFVLEIGINDRSQLHGLRACRVGYQPG